MEIILGMDRGETGPAIVRRLRVGRHAATYAIKLYVGRGRTPAALVPAKLGRPFGRLLEVLPLLRAIRRVAGRPLSGMEFRDALAAKHGIDLSRDSVLRYLKLGHIPVRGRWVTR